MVRWSSCLAELTITSAVDLVPQAATCGTEPLQLCYRVNAIESFINHGYPRVSDTYKIDANFDLNLTVLEPPEAHTEIWTNDSLLAARVTQNELSIMNIDTTVYAHMCNSKQLSVKYPKISRVIIMILLVLIPAPSPFPQRIVVNPTIQLAQFGI